MLTIFSDASLHKLQRFSMFHGGETFLKIHVLASVMLKSDYKAASKWTLFHVFSITHEDAPSKFFLRPNTQYTGSEVLQLTHISL